MIHTKIVCTLGPASEKVEILTQMIEAGMTVARLNFSHGSHEEHANRIRLVRQAAKEAGKDVAIMLDTKGPEIRTGLMEADKILLKTNEHIMLTTEDILGTPERISITYKELYRDVKPTNKILLDDGLIELEVEKVEGTEIYCKVLNGGELSNRKGVNVPGVQVNLPAITEKDKADIHFGIEQEVDFIAASFIRTASDVLEIRKILEDNGADIHIISKIENQEGVDNIEEILAVTDGIMVARGDLGVEIPSEEVPLVQKMLIEKCNRLGKPVITATQMLDSMIRNPRPTRAEANDVANAIFDGTDAIMLSGETAAGKYPLQSVQTMAKIAKRTETALKYEELLGKKQLLPQKTVADAISFSSCNIALELDASAIITPTTSGSTARMISKYRPKSKIIAATPDQRVARKMSLVWGVQPVITNETKGTDEMIAQAVQRSLEEEKIYLGDLVIITTGVPVGVPGTTNLLKVHIVGEAAARGMGIGSQVVTGKLKIAKDADEALDKVTKGAILVAYGTDKDYIKAMEKAAAIITEEGGLTSHAAVVGISLGIPVIVGVSDAMKILEDDLTVTIDTPRGVIYKGVTKAL
ncbi:pyruvate kinase [Desulfitibacter alkalitolerans]|uniref:pyruvate kinase n=1 Tax=Desulfitibacter alkalitolerans TaxID=264641 RepID=UPI000487726C|nr:pyruvate kinase [Desulfitibacter alkalitolerans]